MNILPFKTLDIPEEIKKEVDKLHPQSKLFGSRYMSTYWGYKNKADNSDWDFAFPYEGSEAAEVERATSLGWVEKPTEKYKDNMHFITWEKHVGVHKVQMCSKINLRLFIEVFQSLDPTFYWTYLHTSSNKVLPKDVQTAIFNQLYVAKGFQ